MSKVLTDLTRCQGYGNCVAAAPEVFDLADNGLVTVLKDRLDGAELDEARDAASLCPVQAITISDD